MRLWHYKLIPYLPDKMLISQWRELIAIKRQWEKGTLKHRLVSYVMNYDKKYFYNYIVLIILELKDKLKTTSAISEKADENNKLDKIVEENSKFAEATAALQVLGYTRKEIEKALNKVDASLTVEEIIKKGLNNLARQ